jgi:hypothetical protein
VLTIVLKRFIQKSNGRFEKISEHVDIPQYLDLSDYMLLRGSDLEGEVRSKYKLYAVVVHQGNM